jgi:DNA-directed RNA polymerase subunit M/transcription elongation factor TFIIS
MEFCTFCDNMLYIQTSEDDAHDVRYVCKNCNHTKDMPTDRTVKIFERIHDDSFKSKAQDITKNIEHDPTIPHIQDIKCPNDNCTKSEASANDIMYIKTDSINMTYVYYCVYCKHFWENRFKI